MARRVSTCLGLCLTALLALSPAAAFAVDLGDLFELDGDVEDGVIDPGDDWASLHAGTQDGNPIATTDDVPLHEVGNVTTFTGGSSKDINDIDEWLWTNGNVPDKDDMQNAAAAAYINGSGELVVYFMADRIATNGDAFLGVWLEQDDVARIGDTSGTFDGVHIEDDVLVLANWEQGGAGIPEIRVYVWDPTCTGADASDPEEDQCAAANLRVEFKDANAECDPGSGDSVACAIANHSVINVPWDYQAKSNEDCDPSTNSPDACAPSEMPLYSFFEGGVNITQALNLPQGQTPCFANFLAETRASTSEEATLKDFIDGGFGLCKVDISKECSADFDTGIEGNARIDFHGIVSNPGVSVEVVLEDQLANSGDPDAPAVSFDAVCFVSDETTACPGDGAVTLTGGALGDPAVTFVLPAGALVRYEGHYSTPLGDPTTYDPEGEDPEGAYWVFSDTMLAYSTTNAPGSDEPATSATDGAECYIPAEASLEVFKTCDDGVVNAGSSVTFKVHGTGENTGDIPLEGLSLDDNITPQVPETVSLYDVTICRLAETATAPYGTDDCATEDPLNVGPGDLFYWEGFFDLTNGTAATDRVTVNATNPYTSETVSDESLDLDYEGPPVDASDTTCALDVEASFDLTKACNGVELVPDSSGHLEVLVSVSGTLVNTGDVQLTLDSITDVPDVGAITVYEQGDATKTSVSVFPPDDTITYVYEFQYYPTGTEPISSFEVVPFPDEVTVEMTAALGAGFVEGQGFSANTECPLCPPVTPPPEP